LIFCIDCQEVKILVVSLPSLTTVLMTFVSPFHTLPCKQLTPYILSPSTSSVYPNDLLLSFRQVLRYAMRSSCEAVEPSLWLPSLWPLALDWWL